MANCAMMNIPPTEAKHLTLYEYGALIHNWSLAHGDGADAPPPLTDDEIEETQDHMRRLEQRGVKVLH